MKLKSEAKFEEKLTCGSKNDIRNLVNFNVSSGKSENVNFDVLFLSKVYYIWAKYRGVMCHNSAECAKFEEELTCAFKNDIEFDKFWPNNWKSQNLHFNRLFLTKVYKLVNFASGFRLQLMHMSLIKSNRSSLTHLHGFQLLVLLP